jgi:excinuclease ABC subunit A
VQCAGTPEDLAAADTHTSAYLREELERTRAAEEAAAEIAAVGANGYDATEEDVAA